MLRNREGLTGVKTPKSMAGRPIDHRGFPVPWFVTRKDKDGHWDFVNLERERFNEAVRKELCWVSGQKLGRYRAFCVGPMCVVNRTAGDPPVTREVAEWSVKVCPFMSRPLARRNARDENKVVEVQDGISIRRNPGVTVVYVSCNSEYQRGRGFYLGDPVSVTWWREGRPATRDEAEESIASGLPILEAIAREEGMARLDWCVDRARALLPRDA